MFRALAEPARRRLLDALVVEDGQTLGQLCLALPTLSRFGVMKHLAVLEDAGLVVTHREGRSKLHDLNPVPLRVVLDRWISKYAEASTEALTDLRRRLDGA